LKSEKSDKVFRFVKASEFALPANPVSEKARSFLISFWRNFSDNKDERKQVDVQAELRNAPEKLLEWVAPYPDWKIPALEIYAETKDWSDNLPDNDYFRIILAPPGGGSGEMLEELASMKGWPIVAGPDFNTLLSRDFSWIDKIVRSNETPLVIPRLERLFLRHFNGLEHIRLFFEKMFLYGQHCLIGANSWLWKYLEVALHVNDTVAEPYLLQGLDAGAMQRFFCDLESQKGENPTIFRQADDGSFVLPFEDTSDGKLDNEFLSEYDASEEVFPSMFIKKLARQSRGITLVAWSIWRSSLRLAPENDVEATARDAAVADRGRTIWVKPYEKVFLPEISKSPGKPASYLLQFLLLHDGLPPEVVYQLLEFDKDLIFSILQRFRKAGLVVPDRGLWRVSWQGYPQVRNFLEQEDYLLDFM
jgi:hypothetical protein